MSQGTARSTEPYQVVVSNPPCELCHHGGAYRIKDPTGAMGKLYNHSEAQNLTKQLNEAYEADRNSLYIPLPVKPNTKHTSVCLQKAGDDEPIFVLRAHDILSPTIVREWAHLAEQFGASTEKVRSAWSLAREMENWPDRKNPD